MMRIINVQSVAAVTANKNFNSTATTKKTTQTTKKNYINKTK